MVFAGHWLDCLWADLAMYWAVIAMSWAGRVLAMFFASQAITWPWPVCTLAARYWLSLALAVLDRSWAVVAWAWARSCSGPGIFWSDYGLAKDRPSLAMAGVAMGCIGHGST
jgi:hypothetical protein